MPGLGVRHIEEQWANQEPRGRDWWPTDQWGRRGRGLERRKLESMYPNVYFPDFRPRRLSPLYRFGGSCERWEELPAWEALSRYK